jgi:hypothetical protein
MWIFGMLPEDSFSANLKGITCQPLKHILQAEGSYDSPRHLDYQKNIRLFAHIRLKISTNFYGSFSKYDSPIQNLMTGSDYFWTKENCHKNFNFE